MDVRQRTEEIERLTLAPWATFSDASRGRVRPEEQDPIRPVFQRDRDRIIHCKAFRRLKQKTQVFLSPEGDLYRTRLTHTLEVAQIARTIARALRLNEDLTEAISLAHDLGHTPFGHAGESALDKLCPEGFRHYMQSLRVVDKLEKDGRGLNLTWEVRNGIVTHTKGTWAATPEGRIVRMADQIAFVNHDIEDAVRAGVLDPATLPRECTAVLGETKSQRITTMINSILRSSEGDVQVGAVGDIFCVIVVKFRAGVNFAADGGERIVVAEYGNFDLLPADEFLDQHLAVVFQRRFDRRLQRGAVLRLCDADG